ncbi:MAG: Cof-type HAD-IIB family hydrolase [Proteobacteria bacterium]|nr:Cof-type HAD-IIB family hydrolase [Pseudomonadota bacterium]
MRFRLLALDADGTTLDESAAVRPAVRGAVRAAGDRGVHVVLCTGRRYRTSLPILQELGIESGAAVLQNGVLVKDVRSGETLHHRYLSREIYPEVLDVMRGVGAPLVYVDHHHEGLDFVTEAPERAHPFQGEYVGRNQRVCRVVDSLDPAPSDALVMMSCLADELSLRALASEIATALGTRIRTNFLVNKNYRGHILEAVSAGSGKWPALVQLAAGMGIEPEEILAIGDDTNDAEMLAGAGLGVAMANAVPQALAAADHVTASNSEDGVARAIERFLL